VGVRRCRAKGGHDIPSILVAVAIAGQVTHHTPQHIDAGQHGEQLASFLVCHRRATWPGCLGSAASHLSDVAFQQEATVVDKAQPTTDGPRSVITNLGRQFVTQRHQRGDCLLHHGVNFGERHRRLRFGLGIDCDRSAFGLREMCAQLVAGSFAFIGERHFGTRMPFCRIGPSEIASRRQWLAGRSRVRSGPRCAMRALRRELENLAGDAKGKGASGRAPMRATLPAPPSHWGRPENKLRAPGGNWCPVFFSASTAPGLLGRPDARYRAAPPQ
jgi:hypothetical protein